MSFRENTKRIFTAALVFWMSGVIVLFCCGTMPTEAAETESCPLAKKGHCAKNIKENSANCLGVQNNALDCCAAPAKIFDKNRKTEKSLDLAIVAKIAHIDPPKFLSSAKFFASKVHYQSFAENRSATYLQNCVFRI